MARILLLIYILLLPLDGTSYLNVYLGFINITIADFLLVVLLYAAAINAFALKLNIPLLFRKYFYLFALAIVFSLVSLAYIPANTISYDLKITLNLIEYVSLFFIVTVLVDDVKYFKKILIFFCVGTLIFSTLTIMKSLGMPMDGYVRHSNGRMGPFFIGTVALFNGIMPFSLITLASIPIIIQGVFADKRWVKVLLISVVVLAAIISFSRNLWVAVIGQSILLSYFNVYAKLNTSRKFLYSAVFALVLLFSAHAVYQGLIALKDVRAATVENRLTGYNLALDLATSNITYFLFGTGKGSYIQQSFENTGDGTVVHNFLLDLFVSKGIFMALTIMAILFGLLRRLHFIYRHSDAGDDRKALALVLLMAVGGMLLEGIFAPITSSIIFWTEVSLAYSFVLVVQKEEARHAI